MIGGIADYKGLSTAGSGVGQSGRYLHCPSEKKGRVASAPSLPARLHNLFAPWLRSAFIGLAILVLSILAVFLRFLFLSRLGGAGRSFLRMDIVGFMS